MSKELKFEVSSTKNKKLGQQSGFQKVWKILLSKQTNAKADDSNFRVDKNGHVTYYLSLSES